MNTGKHTVTIPIEDYNKMLEYNERHERLSKSYAQLKTAIDDRLNNISRCMVSINGLDLSAEHQDVDYMIGTNGYIIIQFETTQPC